MLQGCINPTPNHAPALPRRRLLPALSTQPDNPRLTCSTFPLSLAPPCLLPPPLLSTSPVSLPLSPRNQVAATAPFLRVNATMANLVRLLSFLTLLCATTAVDIWKPELPYGPAPPPGLGPPISRNAIRDPAFLKYQIIGIVCGFVGWELIIATLLFTVGKRLRRSAQSSHGTLSMEMVKPNRWMADVSPGAHTASPGTKWGLFKSGQSSVKSSPITPSEAHFDARTVQSDKERQDEEMARIYDTVFAQETKAPREVSIKEQEVGGNGHVRNLSASSRSFSQRRPPQLQQPHQTADRGSPPMSPGHAASSRHGSYHSDQIVGAHTAGDYILPSSPRSTHTHSRQASDSSLRSQQTLVGSIAPASRAKHTRKLKNLTISAPIQKYPGTGSDDEEARTPLTPRQYNPPPPPLAPHQHLPRPITPIQDFDDENQDHQMIYEPVDPRRPLPQAAPQRGTPSLSINTSAHQKSSEPPPLPPPPRDRTPLSAGASSNSLPFRSNPSLAHLPGPTSPGPTKTTLLSPRRDRFPQRSQQQQAHPLGFVGLTSPGGGGAGGGGQMSAGLSPMTPYSPYMPFSPMTPVTPRLTTRAERKRRQREEGRRVANAEEDGVRDEKEIWGDAY